MTVGLVLLVITGVLVLCGVGQRVLDRLRLTDRQALLFIGLIIAGGFIPAVPVTPLFSFSIGGALIPLALCIYLWIKADSGERLRSLAAAAVTAVAVYLLGRFMPDEPEEMLIDPGYMHGLAAGVIGYLFGRSRRGAFIAGVVGVMLASVANAVEVWSQGIPQKLALGGAGAFDVIVLSGLIAVLLSELIGEINERIRRGRQRPTRIFKNGEFIRKESEK
ncbi:MAG: DUF1614 domain-containing protein [Clostridia bacterium]|nr:DUF1614 domain-containing protein [Clostridia bacterium]